MSTKYVSDLGKCYGKRGNLHIYKDGGMPAVFMVMKEFDFDANDNIVEGERLEATLIGYVANMENKDYAFDMAQAEIQSYSRV